MPKPSLYARAWMTFTGVIGGLLIEGMGEGMGLSTELFAQTRPPCAACIVLAASPGQSVLIGETLNGIEILVRTGPGSTVVQAAVERIREHDGRPGLWVFGFEPIAADLEAIGRLHRIVIDLTRDKASGDELAFRVKTYLTELRSAGGAVQLGLYADPESLEALRRRDIGAYVDFDVVPRGDTPPPFPVPANASGTLGLRAAGRAEGSLDRWLVPLPEDVVSASSVLRDVARSAPLLPDGLIAGGLVDVRCDGRPVPTLLDPESLATVAVVRGCDERRIVIAPDVPGSTRETLSSAAVIVKVPAVEGRYAEGVQVVGARALTVREIIARHQAAAARQRRQVHREISTGRMTLTFEAPGFPAPLAITSAAVIYSAPDRVEIEQRDVRINGIVFPGSGVPQLPLLEPERVASPPLAIALSDVYRYSLQGEDAVAGVKCYVVKFEPVDRGRTLFAGRAWIAADDFGMVKVSAVQTGLRGAIVSSEQADEFRREPSGVWLLARSEVHQIYEGAGHRTPIHRVVTIDRHEINPPAFEERRNAAYASPSIMLRDTAEGFRYLRREPSTDEKGTPSVQPVVAGTSQRVRTVAVGVIIDPNISRPLPFAGLSYVDFNLFKTGTQMNAFFGGTYGQLAMAVPSLAGTRWQLGGRAFGIASSYNDRAFVEGREDYGANISQRPAHASFWLLRPLTARVSARAGYEFDYTAYDRVSSTSPTFVVPAAQSAHGIRLAVEGQWTGWSASAWWSGARRGGWREWGEGVGEYDAGDRDYQRFGAVLTRSFVASPRLVGRLEAAWMSGDDLDRFSRYSFGSFDNRLRGYPSALIRYDRGGVLRTAAAWAAGRMFRIDGFLDTAYVRDPGFGPGFEPYTGIGAAAEVPAPFGTLVAIEWGYGFQGIDNDGGRGTQVIRISGYKMF
jgi:hypothetical protein